MIKKVDLMKEVERMNAPEEALLQEAKTLLLEADTGHLQMLQAAGLDHQIKEAMEDSERITTKLNMRQIHGVPVLTEDEVFDLCMKYRLKFLESRLYRGTVPNEVGTTIFNFMKKINAPNPEHSAKRLFILAPQEAFDIVSYKTRSVPKDPLLFYKIEDSSMSEPMYALVTKWGNDFTVARRAMGFLLASQQRYSHIMRFVWFCMFFSVVLGIVTVVNNGFPDVLSTMAIGVTSIVCAVVLRGITLDWWRDNGDPRRRAHDELFTEDGWNSNEVHEHNKFFI